MKILQAFILFIYCNFYSQVKDTVYVKFDDSYKEMRKIEFSVWKDAKSSYSFLIEQKEETYPYDNKFRFSHFNRNEMLQDEFERDTPLKLRRRKSFLLDKKILDIEFFRTTPYIKVCKTFEEEESWEQDVVIFMIDVEEIKNDTIVLWEVGFSRPVKQ